jgi:hypothetical protein
VASLVEVEAKVKVKVKVKSVWRGFSLFCSGRG